MKLPFRFHRGELNGFFLRPLVTFLNFAVGDIIEELVYWANVQFKTESEVTSGEVAMRDDDILGIATIAGVFPLYMAGGVWRGMVYFTQSNVVAGKERSERGLYVGSTDSFKFIRVENNDYPNDIVTEATPAQRATHVPEGYTPLGYVRADQPLYDINGHVIWANVHPAPPVGVAYDLFYGEQFLTMSNDISVISVIPIELVKALIVIMQNVRRNGPSTKTFLDLTNLLCGEYIYDINIEYNNMHFIVFYSLNELAAIENRLAKFTIWQYIARTKFKLFELSEVVI
jgi:hypothetical protein